MVHRNEEHTIVEKRFLFIKQRFQKLGIILRDYQEFGIRWMLRHEANKSGALLADDPGLGKTYQSLALVFSSKKKTLIIARASILNQWTRDAKKLCGDKHVHLFHGTQKFPNKVQERRVLITTPQTLLKSTLLRTTKWDRIIFDEVHDMKNRQSKISQAVMNLYAPLRWGLSGTPIQNNVDELRNIFYFVTNQNPDSRRRRATINLEKLTETHLLRRQKAKVLDLPGIEIENHVIDFQNEKEREFYQKVRKNVRDEFLATETSDSLTSQEKMVIIFELLLRLRQSTLNPQLVIQGYLEKMKRENQFLVKEGKNPLFSRHSKWTGGDSSKHTTLIKLLKSHPKDASIVFCQFTKEMDIIQELAEREGLIVRRLDGSMNQSRRQTVLDECSGTGLDLGKITKSGVFNGLNANIQGMVESYTRVDVFLIQIKAGGVGLNLQQFNRVYITSPDWNPANEEQAWARAHRFGQDKKVFVKRILVQDSTDKGGDIDSKLLGIQEEKRKLYAKYLKDDALAYNGKFRKGLKMNDFTRLLC